MSSESEHLFLQVCICTYNNCESLLRTLKSLDRQNPTSQKWGVLVVDNNSNDNTYKTCTDNEFDFELSYIFEPVQGLNEARARAIISSNSNWVLFVDDDNELFPDYICEGVNYLTKNPTIAGFNGKNSARFETEVDSVLQGLTCFANGFENTNTEQAVPMLYGAGMFLNREKIQTCGWLNIQYIGDRTSSSLVSGGDNELSLRVAGEGGGLWLNPKCSMIHHIDSKRIKTGYLLRLHFQLACADPLLNAMCSAKNFKAWKKEWGTFIARLFKHRCKGLIDIVKGQKRVKAFMFEFAETIGTTYGFIQYAFFSRSLRQNTFGLVRIESNLPEYHEANT